MPDDLFGRKRRRSFRFGFRADAVGDAMFGRRRNRPRSRVLGTRDETYRQEDA
jgi:hypothetical protein